jgi:hypothetical protein
MALWQAQVDHESLGMDTLLVVSSPHQVVRMLTADQLSIETSDGIRLPAIVLDRTGNRMTLSLLDGRSVGLEITSDHSLEHEDGQIEFSRQEWRVDNLA